MGGWEGVSADGGGWGQDSGRRWEGEGGEVGEGGGIAGGGRAGGSPRGPRGRT